MIIFLDIDGVIATRKSYKEEKDRIDRNCVKILNLLTDKLNADIVISSTWRHNTETPSILKHAGVKADIVGTTPRVHLSRDRGIEILTWMSEHKYVGDYLIIDDDSFDIVPHIPSVNFLYIKNGFSESGLTMEHINNIINPPTFKGEWLEEESWLAEKDR